MLTIVFDKNQLILLVSVLYGQESMLNLPTSLEKLVNKTFEAYASTQRIVWNADETIAIEFVGDAIVLQEIKGDLISQKNAFSKFVLKIEE